MMVLTQQLVLKIHDKQAVGVPLADTMIHALGYADDLTVVEEVNAESIERSTMRVTNIAVSSKMML